MFTKDIYYRINERYFFSEFYENSKCKTLYSIQASVRQHRPQSCPICPGAPMYILCAGSQLNVFLMDCFWEICSTSFTKSISCPSGHLKPPGRFGALIKTVKYSNFVAFLSRQTPTGQWPRMDGFYLPTEILQGGCGRGLTPTHLDLPAT